MQIINVQMTKFMQEGDPSQKFQIQVSNPKNDLRLFLELVFWYLFF